MRKRLQAEGKWHGKLPSHTVPAQEEGEPEPKEPRLRDPRELGVTWGGQSPVPESPYPGNRDIQRVPRTEPEAEDDGPPPLEDPPTAEGKWPSILTGFL